MIDQKKIVFNAYSSISQIILVSITGLLLYRYIILSLGLEIFGGWTLILALISIIRLLTSGLSSSLTKFVAEFESRKESILIAELIETVSVSVTICTSIFLFATFFLLYPVLNLTIGKAFSKIFFSIIPIVLISVWFTTVSVVFQAGLSGLQRFDLRCLIMSIGSIIYLVLALLLIPFFGIIGLAYAHTLHSFLITVGTWLLLRNQINTLPIIPYHWNYRIIKEIFSYGVNLQIISVSQILFDPVTKALIAKFGGLRILSYYELVTWIITQIRLILLSANQVIVPVIANLQNLNPSTIKSIFIDSNRVITFLSTFFFSFIIILSPLFSVFWIGHIDYSFVFLFFLISIGYFLNVLSAPAYFTNLGTGAPFWNTLSHLVIGILNLVLGFILGYFADGLGVVTGSMTSLIIGSCMIFFSLKLRINVSFRKLFSKSDIIYIFCCIFNIIFIFIVFLCLQSSIDVLLLLGILLLTYLIMGIIPTWLNPMRKRLFNLSHNLFN